MRLKYTCMVACAAGTAFLPHVASAAPANLIRPPGGYTIYNKAGASMAEHDAAFLACRSPLETFVGEAKRDTVVVPVSSATEAAAVGIGGALLTALFREPSSAVDNCMVVQGWRVVRLSDEEGQRLDLLGAPQLVAAIAPLVGAADAPGDIVRIWANEAAEGQSTRIIFGHTLAGGPKRLSLKAAKLVDRPKPSPMPRTPLERVKHTQPWAGKSIKPAEAAILPPGAGAILVQVDGLNFQHETGIILTRMGPGEAGRPFDDGLSRLAAVKVGFPKTTGMMAFYVPPGRWRLGSITGTGRSLSLCLGAPAFEVKPGELVYAGRFDFKAADVGPNLDLGPVRTWLGSSAVPTTLRAADYVNGTTSSCAGDRENPPIGIYAFEVAGAPYEPSYTWGGSSAPQGLRAASDSPRN